MTAINVNANLANIVSPFVPNGGAEITNPQTSSPFPPVQQTENVDRTINRVERRNQGAPGNGETEEEAVEPSPQERGRASSTANPGEFTEQELATLQKLRATDAEVRAHELAHQAVGGRFAGSASFEYETGPDGQRYAVAGEVPIRLPTGEGDPEQRLRQAEQVIRAALAPAEPSAQDRSVAARASQIKIEAQAEIREQAAAEDSEGSPLEESEASSNFIYPISEVEESSSAAGQVVRTQV